MSYRLVAIDIDGTLLTDEYQVTPQTAARINEALHHAELVLCTGRSLFSAKHVLAFFPREFPLITDNGATVWQPEAGVVWQKTIPQESVRQVLTYCRGKGVHVDFTTSRGVYVEAMDEELMGLYQRYNARPAHVPDLLGLQELPVKITLTGKTTEQMDEVYEALVEQCGSRLQLVRSGPYFIDGVALGVSKGETLKRYAAEKGISLQETIAIGNYYNDLEMLQAAGLGVAVANAPREIREMADFVTDSNNREGVRKVLEQFVLPKGVQSPQ